ncbi:LysR family transcriptional regulator [Bradyrhizobium sp.]|uniref:LysR family transcriptional regulator n=1 Tax=Bradyrhizobium sp. TaxID=376 RepID=UPI002D6A64C2|nr:LysR family transcriptional regulator [Bradyrhizobium sp.]HZR76957.1 LysR family transcriptional regulator [Bradyrhizobium sp.]
MPDEDLPQYPAKMQELDWHDLRYVLAVAREEALAGAARTLRVNETTIARRIARAELILGSKLFHRTRGKLLPTETGQIVIQHAEHIDAEIQTLGERAAATDSRAAGSVRLTANPLLVNRLLIPAITELRAAHPLLQIELVAEPRNLSLTKREADLALRMGRPNREQRVVARRIGDFPFAVYGAADKRRLKQGWIAFDDAMTHLPNAAWIRRAIQQEEGGPPLLTVNDADAMLHSIRNGLGRSLLPCAIADRDPALTRLSGKAPVLTRELWLLVHPDIRHLARIKAVVGWLEQTVKRALSRT